MLNSHRPSEMLSLETDGQPLSHVGTFSRIIQRPETKNCEEFFIVKKPTSMLHSEILSAPNCNAISLHVRLLVANCADERGQTERQKDI